MYLQTYMAHKGNFYGFRILSLHEECASNPFYTVHLFSPMQRLVFFCAIADIELYSYTLINSYTNTAQSAVPKDYLVCSVLHF